MQKILLSLCGLLGFVQLFAQTTPLQIKSPSVTQKGIVYNEERSLNFRLHNQGYALGYTVGKIKTYKRTDFVHVELGILKHIREYRQNTLFSSTNFAGRSYVFGKQNTFVPLRVSWGRKRYYSEKVVKRGVTLGMNYEVGGVLGFIKPYYLELRFQDNTTRDEKYSELNRSRFLDNSQIGGAAPFSTGLSELKITAGGHALAALHLDWGAHDEYLRSMDAGISVDAFPKRIPLMITEDNPPYFVNVFVNLAIGRRN